MDPIEECRLLSDVALISGAERLAAEERLLTKAMLAHLAVMDERKLGEGSGFPSLYHYCWRRLLMSEANSYKMINAARLAKRYRVLLDLVESGQINLGTLLVIAPILQDERTSRDEAASLIDRIKRKSRREVEMIVASIRPVAARRDAVGRAPSSAGSAEWPPAPPQPAPGAGAPPSPPPAQQPTSIGITFSFDKIEAVDGQKVRLHFDVGPETAKLLERAREVMRHKFPLASFEDIVREALKLLLEERDPEIKLKLEKEDAKKVLTDARRVPVWVQRKVWRRDGGRCAYVAADGTRCEERKWLEYDHVVPYAKGGRSDDPKNVRLLCRSHNQLNAWLEFPPGAAASA